MRFPIHIICSALFTIHFIPAFALENVTTAWSGDGVKIYEEGFVHGLMKAPGGGVRLFNMELAGNDAPGAGFSEKGVTTDVVWGLFRARKIIELADPRAESAWLLVYPTDHTGSCPLTFTVNGHSDVIEAVKSKTDSEWYIQAKFPAEWLKKGKNVIDLACPEAKSEREGWEIYIARADEFEAGGGSPKDVGKTSFKSFDGGETWKESPFGPLHDTRAEYSIRLSLDRHVPSGWLSGPVIDLWKGESQAVIVPQREIKSLRLVMESEVPLETTVEYYLRTGSDPQPFSASWSEYRFAGSGPHLDYTTGGSELNRRYVQFRAVLTTSNPLKSPVVRTANLTAELVQRVPLHRNIFVVYAENPSIRYSSFDWQWEPWDRPELRELRIRENLDEVVSGSRTEFDAQVKLLDYVAKRWRHNDPFPEFPGFDALSILNRIDTAGGGGYCLTFNNVLGGMCIAYGWQTRFVNVVGHEVVEVWNDEFGKWIFLDADFQDLYNYDPATATPLDLRELHERYLEYYYPRKSINWLADTIDWKKLRDNDPPPVKPGLATPHGNVLLTGFINAAFMRLVTRNNWFEQPYPRPLSHGHGGYCPYPWDGYLNWYDDRTPPKRNHSLYTDRARDMWPDLNLVHADITQGFGNDRLFLRFETYTPNFSHYEANVDDTGWKEVGERWTWLLQSGRNTLDVRVVSKLGVKGKPSRFIVNHADAPFGE